jgi:CTP:molybdopterin cytidylyltransferase MocA
MIALDAVILAGGQTPPEMLQGLDADVASPDRALVKLNGRPMLDYTLDAVRGCSAIARIAVVGTPAVLQYVEQSAPDLLRLADAGRMIGNAIAGMRLLSEQPNASKLALVTTSDIPLVTTATYEEFFRLYFASGLEAAYALTTRAVTEQQFPGGKRTYAHLADGDYTAGNAIIIEGTKVEHLSDVFEHFYKARKNPLAMAKIFGLGFLWQAVTKRLSKAGAEAKLSELLECRAGAVLVQDASIAFDVDKIEDYRVAAATLQSRNA